MSENEPQFENLIEGVGDEEPKQENENNLAEEVNETSDKSDLDQKENLTEETTKEELEKDEIKPETPSEEQHTTTESTETSNTPSQPSVPSTTDSTLSTTETKTNENESLTHYGLPSFSYQNQKSLSSLTVIDVLMWRNVYASGAIFTALQTLYILLVVYEMTVLSLVSRIFLFSLIIAVGYNVVVRIFTNTPSSESAPASFPAHITINQDTIEPYINTFLSYINTAIHQYIALLRCDDLLKTLEVSGGVWLFGIISQHMSGLTLFYISVWGAFTLPRIYEWQQEPIDRYLCLAWTETKKYAQLVYEKIPKASTVKDKTE